MRTPSRTAVPVLLAAAMALVLVGCGDDDASSGGAGSGDPDVVVEVQLESEEQRLSNVGPDDRVVYGWNDLVGRGSVAGSEGEGDVDVEMLGNVSYRDGEGPFFGFITFTFDDGATLAVRMDGEATASSDTTEARFEADLEVLGGTDRLVDAAGTGTFEGSRPAELGGTVESTFELWLDAD